MPTFDELISEALAAPFSGWDFSWLSGRSTTGQLPWSYRGEVARRAVGAGTMLDMGTGGGERLSALAARSPQTVATEAWPPNVPVAAARLRPLGIPVIQDEGAPDNAVQDDTGQGGTGQDGTRRGRLPFRDETFGLVANRHEAFLAAEVARVLASGGAFITQQVDCRAYDELYRFVGLDVPVQPESWLPLARRQVHAAGLTVQGAVQGAQRHEFHDVGALVYYLRVVSWAIPGYRLERCAGALRAAHDTPELWPASFAQRHFLLVATKP